MFRESKDISLNSSYVSVFIWDIMIFIIEIQLDYFLGLLEKLSSKADLISLNVVFLLDDFVQILYKA